MTLSTPRRVIGSDDSDDSPKGCGRMTPRRVAVQMTPRRVAVQVTPRGVGRKSREREGLRE